MVNCSDKVLYGIVCVVQSHSFKITEKLKSNFLCTALGQLQLTAIFSMDDYDSLLQVKFYLFWVFE